MYTVDGRDRLEELGDIPQSSVGAPLPVVMASEDALVLAFYLQDQTTPWDGKTVRVVSLDTVDECAVVRFKGGYLHLFGPPGDESIFEHPLYDRGLSPYSAFEVFDSSWVREVEEGNIPIRHFIFTFHDSTFECLAQGYEVEKRKGTLRSVIVATWGG